MGCKTNTGLDSAELTIKDLSANTATAECTATVTADGPFKGKTYTKIFTITKQLKGEPGAASTEPGPSGRSVESTTKYYILMAGTPSDIDSSYTEENPPTTNWKTSPVDFNRETDKDKNYWETTRTKYNDNTYSWSTPVLCSMLTADFISALGITAEKIDVGNTFSANATTGAVGIGGFEVSSNSITSGNKKGKTLDGGANETGVYIGPDGISIGDGFKVTAGGQGGDTEITLSDKLMNELKAATYTVISSASQIVRDPVTNNYNPASVEFTCYKQLGSDTPTKLTNADSTFAYSLDGGSTKSELGTDGKVTTSTFTSNSITCELYLIVNSSDRSEDILIASKTVSILNDAVSPYMLDIYNDKVSALTNTGTIDWTRDQWKTSTTHKIKVLQGTVATKLEDITIRAGTYTANDEDKDLVLVYESSNVSSVGRGTNTEYEVVNYITGISTGTDKGEINYTLYYKGVAVASAKFELLKIQFGNDGRSITKVENFYYANNTDSLTDAENPTQATWYSSITATGYGPTKRYLWNYEKITYDKGTPLTSSTTPGVISYYATDGAAGAPSITYWLNCSANIHTGTSQTEAITVTAKTKVGTAVEDTDATARLYYRYATETTWNGGSTSLNITTFKNEDLYILATHKPATGDGNFTPVSNTTSTDTNIYDWETITYSPLNTPTLDLTNDTATIAYATDGTKLGESVSTTANLYLNNEMLATGAVWFTTNCTASTTTTKWWSEISGTQKQVPVNSTITISELAATGAKATCWAFEKLYEPELIVYRPGFTEQQWANYGTIEHDENWTASPEVEPDVDENGNIIKEKYFIVVGKSTDSKKNHILWYKANKCETHGTSCGKCVAHKSFYEKDFTIAKQLKGETGNEGNGVSEIIELYKTTTTADNPAVDTLPSYNSETGEYTYNGWSPTVVQPDSTNPYLWNIEIIKYTLAEPTQSSPAIIGTYGETFGVNIEPSVSSIKLQYPEGEREYSPGTITFKFKEVSGTTVTNCCSTDREYKYKLSKVESGETIPLGDEIELKGSGITEVSLNLSQSANQTTGQYKVELFLKNAGAWIVVDTETIPVVESNETLSCVIESSLGTSFNKSSSGFSTQTTTLTAHLYKGLTEEDVEHTWFYEWYWINNATQASGTIIERLSAEELEKIGSGELTAEKEALNYRGTDGSYQIVLKLSELENKSIYFVAYPNGAPSSDGAILGIARLGVMPLGR